MIYNFLRLNKKKSICRLKRKLRRRYCIGAVNSLKKVTLFSCAASLQENPIKLGPNL